MLRIDPRPRLLPIATIAAALIALAAGGAGAEGERRIRVNVTPVDKTAWKALLASDLDVGHAHGMEIDLRVSPEELARLRSEGHRVDVVNEDVYGGLRGGIFLPQYVTYEEAVAKLDALAAAYPAIAQVSSIGTSIQGRSILALKISDDVAVDEDEPEVLFMGNHHAREVISVILPLALADSLTANYGTDARLTEWVDTREIYIVPTINPDGLKYVETSDLFWRKNRRANGGGSFGVDLNRNYAYEWGHDNNGSSNFPSSETYRGTGPASEPEVAAVQNFIDGRDFVFSISFHSFGNWWLWGPGYKTALGPDQDIFAGYGAQAAAFNGYDPGNPATSTIYITNGDVNDWLYNAPTHAKGFGMTPEVGNSSDYFNPPASRIPQLVAENIEPSWLALEYADRPGRLAPPGQPALDALPTSTTGAYDVTWAAPTTADTEVVEYELVEKTGGAAAADGFESGAGAFSTGGWTVSTTRKFAGAFSLFGGNDDELNNICIAREGHVVQPGESFTFRAWYNIESNWDYFYAIVSTDGGRSFTNLAGTNTTMSDPNGNNSDNGITGSSSNNWLAMTFPLTDYVGQTVWLGFRYFTDAGTTNAGVWVDEVFPVQTWTTSTVLSSSVAGTTFPVSGRTDGTYTYQVRGRDAEGVWGYPSGASSVVVSLATAAADLGASTRLALEANHPNPFARETTIRFSLPSAGSHSLVVYDVAGRLVRTLSEGVRPAGAAQVTWDGRNSGGIQVPSGVYFYRLETPEGRVERRAVVRR